MHCQKLTIEQLKQETGNILFSKQLWKNSCIIIILSCFIIVGWQTVWQKLLLIVNENSRTLHVKLSGKYLTLLNKIYLHWETNSKIEGILMFQRSQYQMFSMFIRVSCLNLLKRGEILLLKFSEQLQETRLIYYYVTANYGWFFKTVIEVVFHFIFIFWGRLHF